MIKHENFSVLMTVYARDNASFFKAALESLVVQTVLPTEIVIVQDGPIPPQLRKTLNDFKRTCAVPVVTISLKVNQGLGRALNFGLKKCHYNLVARMDSDDISLPDRFEKQLKFLAKNTDVEVVGGQIIEFEGSPENISGKRTVPLRNHEIRRFQRRRTSMNHVTVLYQKELVLKHNGYEHVLYLEDSFLWAKLQSSGVKFANLPDNLVLVRAGADQLKRRAGLQYLGHQLYGRGLMLKRGYIGVYDFMIAMSAQGMTALTPNWLRNFIYKKILRNRYENA